MDGEQALYLTQRGLTSVLWACWAVRTCAT